MSVEHPGVALCFGGPKGLGFPMETSAAWTQVWQVSRGGRDSPSIYGLELEINQKSAVWVLDNVALIQETPYEGGWSWTWMPQTGDCLDCLDCLEPETLL
jgi:hypothetical protein